MTIYLCSTAAALSACLAAQATTANVGLLTTATQLPADVTVRWTTVVTVIDQPVTTVVEALQTCMYVVVVADPPASADGPRQILCAVIAALAAHGTTVIFAANAAPLAGQTPGMPAAGLLPDTIVAAGLVHTLDPLTLSKRGGWRRLLVLEGDSYVAFTLPPPTIAVHGSGCVLVITLPAAAANEPTRLIADVLTGGMSQEW